MKLSCVLMSVCIATMTVCLASGVFAQDQNGIKTGAVKLLPYGSVSAIYDSNVRTQPDDEKDDISFKLKAGTGIRNEAEAIKLQADIWALIERYTDLDDEDHEDFGESIKLGLMQDRKMKVDLSQSYKNIQSVDYAVGEIRARELFKAGVLASSELTDKVTLSGAYGYEMTDYELGREFDWDQHKFTLMGSQKLTDKTDGSIAAGVILQDSDGFDESAEQYVLTAGVMTRGTDKVTGTARIGVLSMSADYDDETIAHYDISGRWQATEKMGLKAQLLNGIEPGTLVANDYNEYVRGTLSTDMALVNGFGVACTLGYTRNDYFRPVDVDGVATAKDDDTFSGAVAVTYKTPSPLLTAFVEAKVDDKQSSIPANEYQQTMVTVGANFVY